MKKDGPVNFGALEEICDAPILYILSTVYTQGLYESRETHLSEILGDFLNDFLSAP